MTEEEYQEAKKTREMIVNAVGPISTLFERCKDSPESFLDIDVKPGSEVYKALENAYWLVCDLSGELGFHINLIHISSLK